MRAALHARHAPLLLAALALAAGTGPAARSNTMPNGTPRAATTRVLIVTGGHDFEEQPFFDVFKADPGITFRIAKHPEAHAFLSPAAAVDYDVVVLYDMWQPISVGARNGFVGVLRAGKGLVALHHSLVSYQEWAEYRLIVGGRYYLKDETVDGRAWKASTYKHDERIRVSVADRIHPVTRGVGDFEILDEVYGGYEVLPDSRPLLTTDHPANARTLAWWRTYGPSRIVYLQLGHDHQAYANPNFRRLLANAISWAAGKSTEARPSAGRK